MFIRPLTRISKGEKIMTFIVRPRVGITETPVVPEIPKESCPSPWGGLQSKRNNGKTSSIVSVPVRGLLHVRY